MSFAQDLCSFCFFLCLFFRLVLTVSFFEIAKPLRQLVSAGEAVLRIHIDTSSKVFNEKRIFNPQVSRENVIKAGEQRDVKFLAVPPVRWPLERAARDELFRTLRRWLQAAGTCGRG